MLNLGAACPSAAQSWRGMGPSGMLGRRERMPQPWFECHAVLSGIPERTRQDCKAIRPVRSGSPRLLDPLQDSEGGERDPFAGTARPFELEGSHLLYMQMKERRRRIGVRPVDDPRAVSPPFLVQYLQCGPEPWVPRIPQLGQ